MSLTNATAQSTNTAFVQLASRIGVCAIHTTMTAFGIHGADGSPLGTYPPQVILGAQPVSPQTLANAYAALAAGGVLCQTRPVTSISVRGRTLWAPEPWCHRVADARAVAEATTFLEFNMTAALAGAASVTVVNRDQARGRELAELVLAHTPATGTVCRLGPADRRSRCRGHRHRRDLRRALPRRG
jgi:membrane peptidoglycan carboxypeptidase